jgi:NAD(P)-dependent dehydrogenase (short-subunit alcohol dehydrogenase family)
VSALAVVTGAGTGIGRATASLLAERGLHVVLVGRTAATLEESGAAVVARGGTAETVVADVGSAAGLDRVVGAVGARPVGALVHAAGQHDPVPFVDTTRAQFDRAIAVNLTAPFFLTQALVPGLVTGAGVVFVGSITATRARSLHTAYAAGKAGLIALTKHLAAELAPAVRVNLVSPGATATAMLQAYVDAAEERLDERGRRDARAADRSRILLRRIATPEEVAATIVHLALDATAVTGVDVPVDVGYTAT